MFDNVYKDLYGAFNGFKNNNNIEVIPDNIEVSKAPAEWIRPVLRHAPTAEDIGYQGEARIDGSFIIQIFVKAGNGPKRAYEISDILHTLLSNKKFANGTATGTGVPREVGIDQQSKAHFQVNFSVPFRTYS